MPESSNWTRLHAQLHRTLLQRQILPSNQRLLVAVSGGQDSLCTLKLLLDLQPKWGWNLAIAHCDHCWRSDSQSNANHVENLAKNFGISYYLQTASDIPKTEAAARKWRYQALTEVAIAHNYPYIVTGHTASDRAETLLYNLIRGSGADGLSALTWTRPLADLRLPILDFRLGDSGDNPNFQISADLRSHNLDQTPQSKIPNPKSKIYLVRPLLEITRSQTGQFCQEQKLPIWEDSTNQDLQYARNRIRSQLLPYLETHFNPKTQQALAQTAELLRADVEYLEIAASELLQRAISPTTDNPQLQIQLPVKLNRPILREAPLSLQRRAMRQVLLQILPCAPSFDSVEKLSSLIAAPNRSQTDPFPGGAIARVENPWIAIDI
ncbi:MULTISPECIES: tRNA lysidine(34) synthetase TilS [unclassified Microcoleus]|uniref:tRNA lysidine(34) synthetase TilS n=1 Tax=unclassified Microcoleus TaxID=2642155 RepID=UPI001D5FEB82|nr:MULTISPECIES: tRNA lysidine(34) synthetase TilS [unclassified Microcoleus]MCC3502356.1 tRNA lysidine(34) synthetase TilS [Microcoleus sp. PH2017_19_SFW_U_A]MCC3508963.1 tRNA lysidine(34) synthetase TilS [Microcoleus sp. PH2017_17_BER_D_A]TAE42624.1 MAG: tRNA lysidine(34) synthetase TilS [Oscillatoriales cyanobacterium]MCC3521213.1 tRNA lysidine(34) synthetase TilS [Microcoleus sp. PH2017_20_SFW_D_A]MCC3533488.1 tRNA lysidine(34) synthetase TilS [Microcoleus sp. PH2017_25_DOB_D_A]